MLDSPSPTGSSDFRITRRGALGRAAGLGVAFTISACGGSSSDKKGKGSDHLSLLTFPGYIDPKAIASFTKDTGISVSQSHVGSPQEMFAKTKASPDQYDIVYAGSLFIKQYVNGGLLHPIDESRVKNIKLIPSILPWREALTVSGKLYAILYNWGDIPLAYNAKEVEGKPGLAKYMNAKGEPWDWNILWDPAFKGRVSLWDDPTNLLPVIAFASGIKDPYNMTDAELKVIKGRLKDLRPQLTRFVSGTNDQVQQFVSKEAALGILYAPDVQTQAVKAGIPFKVNNLMKQKVNAWADCSAITKEGGGKNLDAAYSFINYTLSVPWQAQFVAKTGQNGTLDYEQATSAEAVNAGLSKAKLSQSATLIPQTKDPAFLRSVVFNKSIPQETLAAELALWNDFKLGM